MQKSGWVQERRLIWMYCQLNLLPKEAPKGTQDVSSGLSVVMGACFPMVWDTARIRPLKPATPVLTFVSFPQTRKRPTSASHGYLNRPVTLAWTLFQTKLPCSSSCQG